MSVSRRLAVLLGACLVLAAQAPPALSAQPNLDAYRGLGTWVDIYDYAVWGRPEQAVAAMKERGVCTLFLETANFRSADAIVDRAATGRFLAAAHTLGVRVVAWYLPSSQGTDQDYERSLAAIRFRFEGHAFDSFGLDVEHVGPEPEALRNERVVELSRRLRESVGEHYPLSAITLPPAGLERVPGYWDAYPFRELARYYDVFVPMSYHTYRMEGEDAVYDYTARNIDALRERVGDARLPIHVIGGLAGDSDHDETRGFARALRDSGALGASLYDWTTTGPEDWSALADTGSASPLRPCRVAA
jgi:hypothetical protein